MLDYCLQPKSLIDTQSSPIVVDVEQNGAVKLSVARWLNSTPLRGTFVAHRRSQDMKECALARLPQTDAGSVCRFVSGPVVEFNRGRPKLGA